MIYRSTHNSSVCDNNVLGKICTINICGMSQRSNMMLDKYASENDFLIIGVQETGSGNQWKTLTNRKTFQDTNNNRNKGCAIIVKQEIMFVQFHDISKLSSNIDTVWGMLSWHGKRYIVGNLYLKLDYLSGVKEMLDMLEAAHELIYMTDQTKVLGVILDEKLNYKQHSKSVYNNLIHRWVSLSRYANRNWGMNQAVIVRITKTVLFSALFYGSLIWMNNSNMDDINKLLYKVSKAATGAVS